MTWYRAATAALLLHLAVLVLFTFTFPGTREMYRIDLIFWGSILRPQEVSSQERRLPPSPVDVKNVDADSGPRTQPLLWTQEISMDKPDFFSNFPFAVKEDSFRFAGKRVDLDEPVSHPDNDIPAPAPVKMRWAQP